MIALSVIQGAFSPRATEEERRRAIRKLVQLRVDETGLREKIASLLMDMNVHSVWEAFWSRIVKMYEVPSYLIPTMKLDARTILLGIPPWEAAARRFVPNMAHAKKRAAEHGVDLFVDDEEERYSRMLDVALLHDELTAEQASLAYYQSQSKLRFPKELGGRPVYHYTLEACEARIKDLEGKLATAEDGLRLLEMPADRRECELRTREQAARAADPVVEVGDDAT